MHFQVGEFKFDLLGFVASVICREATHVSDPTDF